MNVALKNCQQGFYQIQSLDKRNIEKNKSAQIYTDVTYPINALMKRRQNERKIEKNKSS